MSAQDGPSLPSVWPCSDPGTRATIPLKTRVPSASSAAGQVEMGLAVSRCRSACSYVNGHHSVLGCPCAAVENDLVQEGEALGEALASFLCCGHAFGLGEIQA